MWANNTRREITSPKHGGYDLLTPSHCCSLLFCLLFNVVFFRDMSGKQACPSQLLQYLLYGREKVQRTSVFIFHVMVFVWSALPCQTLRRWSWRSRWSGWQRGSSSCRPRCRAESHRSIPEHPGWEYSFLPSTQSCSSSAETDPARRRATFRQCKKNNLKTENERSDFKTSRAKTKVSRLMAGKRQWRKERNIQRRDKQEIRGEFCARDDISGTVKATLMIRHKQEREGLPLPRREISLHHKSQAGGCSMRTDGPSLAIVPAPLLPCQQALPWTLIHAISVHFMSTSKANKQGPPQYQRKQLFLPLEWGICWWGVGEIQATDPPPFKHSDKELTFQDTDTAAETDRPFQPNSLTDHPPTRYL